MTCGGPCLAVLGAALLFAQAAPPAAQQDPAATFRAGADIVSVEASVRRDKRPITGLKITDFELLDNGVRQEITALSYERLPIDVTSSLTSAPASPVRCSTSCANPSGSRRSADFEAPASAADAAFEKLAGYGSSAIFDSVAVALASPAHEGAVI